MPRKFADIAFTPAVKALQTQYGSRATYEKFVANGPNNDTLDDKAKAFIPERDGFYLGSVTETGWPYIQFRGGPPGFLKILDDRTLGFADFSGNAQYLTTGNLLQDNRVFLFLMDYAHRRRMKIWGQAEVKTDASALLKQLTVPDYPAIAERAILIHIVAFDWNCPQHIPRKYSDAEVDAKLDAAVSPLQRRVAELEAQLESLHGNAS